LGGLLMACSTVTWAAEPPTLADASVAYEAPNGQSRSSEKHVQALNPDDIDTFYLGTIVVSGKRMSLATAQDIKRSKLEIVDSVVAEDINKLPDFSVTDALQRITGIQIARDRGEGTNVAIRGLTQMETTLNGREVFTAGWGRNLDFADIPAEMVSGIDVYKTGSARQIEGGIGGVIDLRTRRPFDFGGQEFVATGRVIHGDLVNASKPQFSLLASDRWKTGEAGEVGALLNLSYQKRAWREDQKSTGNPTAITVAGQTVFAPNGASDTVTLGERERIGASLVTQWRPTAALDLYAEVHYAQFKTMQNGYQLFITPSGTFSAGSVTLFPGTSDAQGITWTNPSVASWGSVRDTIDRTTQVAAGGSWTLDALTLKSDVSYTTSHNNLFYSVITVSGTAASLTQDAASGTNLLSTPTFTTAGMVYASRPFDGQLAAAQVDGEYRLARGFLETLSAGLRYARRDATDAPGQVTFSASVPVANAAGLTTTNPYNGYLIGDPSAAGDVAAVRSALGVTSTIPTSNPLGTWFIREDTLSGYLMARLKKEPQAWDGNFGLRIVRTRERVSGNQSNPSGSGVLPIDSAHDYLDLLPSVNLRYELEKGLYLRAAASKTLTRPDFNQLSPSLTLNTVQLTGSAGNPELKPVRSNNLDLAVERYFSKTTSAHLTAFLKSVDGFVTTLSSPEVHDGQTYQVSRPQNANPANIKGVELGYQQFYDFLPGWLSSLGLQANYTYVDSDTPNSTLGANVPLQNLSRHSVNLIGMYENGKLSARIAYNWRDKFLSGVSNISGVGALPVYTKAYGWLDASMAYRVSDKLSITVEGLNLLRTVRSSYHGVETRPQNTWINDRQFGVGVTMKF
jgi:iron complex outermembrane receptor protein